MATWKPAPKPTDGGAISPNTGKFVQGTPIGSPLNTPPPGWIGAPASGSGTDGTDVFTTG